MMLKQFLVECVLSFILLGHVASQKTYMYMEPDECDKTDNGCNYMLYMQEIDETSAYFEFNLNSTSVKRTQKDSFWLGFGFNLQPAMGGADVIVCKNFPNGAAVERYQTQEKKVSYLNSNQPTMGLTSTSVEWNEDMFNCSGIRSSEGALYDITKPGFLIMAVGSLDSQKNLQKHNIDQGTDEEQVFFSSSGNETATANSTTSVPAGATTKANTAEETTTAAAETTTAAAATTTATEATHPPNSGNNLKFHSTLIILYLLPILASRFI